MVKLTGTPLVLDAMLRGPARLVQVTVGLLASAALGALGAWWWAPLPLAASFLLYELFFWARGDRPVALTIAPGRLTVSDPAAGRTVELDLADVHAATVHVRPAVEHGRQEAVLVLASASQVLLALRFLVEPGIPLRREDVQADAMDALVGGYGGLLRSLASPENTCRQTIDDPAAQALAALRDQLDPRAWERTAVRVWAGAAPDLDTFGLHVGPPDGMLVLDRDQWTLRLAGSTRSGVLTLVRSARSSREVGLARKPSALHDDRLDRLPVERVDVPLLVLELDEDLVLAFPALEAGRRGDARTAEDGWLHTHVPEGAAALWHILTRWPENAWPVALRAAAVTVLADFSSRSSGGSRARSRPRSPSRER